MEKQIVLKNWIMIAVLFGIGSVVLNRISDKWADRFLYIAYCLLAIVIISLWKV